jgi:hypothetical protein
MSFNRWMYSYGNPINYADPSGNKPLPPPHLEALRAKKRFYAIIEENKPDAFMSFYQMFVDQGLLKLSLVTGETSKDRLDWLLWITSKVGNPMAYGQHFAEDFGSSDSSLKDEFRDQIFYDTDWNSKGESSNQVGHFLSAVDAAGYGIPGLRITIGHEQKNDGTDWLTVARSPNKTDIAKWGEAITADENGNSKKRDELLWQLLRFSSETPFGCVEKDRKGQSLQDLRLSLKGFRFRAWVDKHPSSPPDQAGSWIYSNLMK